MTIKLKSKALQFVLVVYGWDDFYTINLHIFYISIKGFGLKLFQSQVMPAFDFRAYFIKVEFLFKLDLLHRGQSQMLCCFFSSQLGTLANKTVIIGYPFKINTVDI